MPRKVQKLTQSSQAIVAGPNPLFQYCPSCAFPYGKFVQVGAVVNRMMQVVDQPGQPSVIDIRVCPHCAFPLYLIHAQADQIQKTITAIQHTHIQLP